MNTISGCFLLTVFVFALYSGSPAQTIPQDSLFLGQPPPGSRPKLFQLPVRAGLFAAERIGISPAGTEIYYSELNNYPPSTLRIRYLKYSNDRWNGPYDLFDGYMAPGLTISGDTMFFEKLQGGGGTPVSFFSVRSDTVWSVPVRFMPTDQRYKHYIQPTYPGDIFLSSNPAGGAGGLDWCSLTPGNPDTVIKSLGIPLNTSVNDADFYIARDGSFMVISSYPTSVRHCNGYLDLFVSYRRNDGAWTNPKNLGTKINVVNPSDGRWGPYVTDDKKYLFYSRGTSPSDGGINWVRIDSLIDSLKQTNFVPYVKYPVPDLIAARDSLFFYQIPDSTILDDDGNGTLTFSATLSSGAPLPAWLSFDSLTQTFSGVPASAGSLNLKVSASDTAGATASVTFRITISNPSGVGNGGALSPAELQLFQNYPNPFNPSTTISYTLERPSHVRLVVYNILSQQICILYNGHQNAGSHSLLWDAKDGKNNPVGSGIYFYRLETDNGSIEKKMILLK